MQLVQGLVDVNNVEIKPSDFLHNLEGYPYYSIASWNRGAFGIIYEEIVRNKDGFIKFPIEWKKQETRTFFVDNPGMEKKVEIVSKDEYLKWKQKEEEWFINSYKNTGDAELLLALNKDTSTK